MTICSLTLADSVYADAIKVLNCKVQNEDLVEIVNSAILGTTVTMNSVHRYLADIKFDEVSETINDLTYGSIETGFEEALTTDKTIKNHQRNTLSFSIKEIINFKKIPNKKSRRGIGIR